MNQESTKNKVVSGMFWKFGERMLAQLISFLVSIALARILMPEEYGIVSIVLIFINLANVFVTSGFSTSLIQKKDAGDLEFSTIFYCSLAVSIIIYSILFLVAPYISTFYDMPSLTLVIRIFSICLIINSYNSIQHAYVSKNMIFKKFFFSTFIGTILSGIIGIYMAYRGCGVWALVAQHLTNSIIDSLVLSFTISWHPKLKFSFKTAKELMGYGWKVLAADFSGTFFEQLRSLLIGKVYTATDLAYYNKGKQIPTLVSDNVGSTIMTVLFPAIATECNDISKVKEMAKKSLKIMSYIIFPMLIGCAVVARPLILMLLTEKWSSSVLFMQLLCISSAISIISNVSLQVIKAVGRSDVLLKLEIYKKPLYFALLIVGASISVLGVAITTVVYSVLSMLINSYAMQETINYKLEDQIKDILPSLSITCIMGVCVHLLSLLTISNNVWLLVVQIVIGIIVYWILSKLLKIQEYEYLKNIVIERIKEAKNGKNKDCI